MKIRTEHLVRRRTSNRGGVAVNSVAAAVAAVLAGASGTARAQEQDKSNNDVIEEVMVTGIRHSIETSIATKRESNSVVEVVSAEDIGKLPDTSIADSIARLPGVTAQRIDGRPAAISIRGLGEDYAGALLNGRQVVSSSEGRSAEYDQFPSELVNQVLVYKTVDAGVVGQGLSGTIDVRPLMPLSIDHRQVAIGARAEHNSNGSLSSTGNGAYGSRYSASYVDQYANHTLGLALGYAHLDSPGQAKKYGAWAFGDYDGQWGSDAAGVPLADGSGNCLVGDQRPGFPDFPDGFPVQDCAVFQQGFESSVTSSKQARDGVLGVVQYKPNDRFSSVVDLYYSKFTQDRVGHFWVGDIGLWSGTPADFTNVGTEVVNGNTIIESGTVANGHSLVYDKNWDRTDKIKSIGWRNELELGTEWKGSLDLGYSHSDRDEVYIQSVARANAVSSFDFSIPGGNGQTAWSTPQDLTDPAVVQLANDPNYAELRDPKIKDEIKSLQLSANRSVSWGWFGGLDMGLAYNQRDKSVTSDSFYLQLNGASDPNLGLPLEAIPAEALRAPVMIDVGGIQQNVLSWDVPSIMSLYDVVPKDPWSAQTSKFKVHEKVDTGFLKFDIDSKWGAVPVRGNLGVQVVHTDQASDGFSWNDGAGTPSGGAVVPVHGGDTYTDVLPSLNLVFDLKTDLILRFGLGKTMARPRMDDMRAGADQPVLQNWLPTHSPDPVDPGHWVAGGGGKPDLQPWRADSVDLSVEKYIQRRSYVAVAGFWKKLNSFIYERTTTRDFSGFVNYDPTLTPGCSVSQPNCDPNLGEITTQDNGSGGKVYGFEVSVSLDGSLFTPALDGVGLVLSDSKTYNGLPDDENGNPINLDGFSGTVNSIEAYFERGGFSARISERYRSAFTATTRGVILNTLRSTHIDAERQLDAQLGYAFNSGALNGLTLLLQGNNLTNAPSVTRQSPETVGAVGSSAGLLPWEDDNYGVLVLLGASYKF
ncbi:MAG TPA: TonB-dependent receptor [Steroidobacteraceae bacterium]|nr:TonB-dependent receptor [Steroidobacteraceae bacterium]